MSRIEELKKQNPQFSLNYVDIINELFDKPIYTEMVINLLKNQFNVDRPLRGTAIRRELVNEFKIDNKTVEDKSLFQLLILNRLLNDTIGFSEFRTITKFIELHKRNLLGNNDLTSYKTYSDLELQISLSELKLIDKEMEKQVMKLYDNDEWLIIKPLSFLASKKYGANTKWCTTQENNPEYYLKFSRRGILIYVINKITGNKIGVFKNIDMSYGKEISFWNMVDERIDSMESDLPFDILNIIKDDFNQTTLTNWELLSDDEKNKQTMWLQKNYYESKMAVCDEGEISIREDYELSAPLSVGFRLDLNPEYSVGENIEFNGFINETI
jgi:hypothetical protein